MHSQHPAIIECLNSFNFENVHKIMVLLDWKYAMPAPPYYAEVPNIERLKECAEYLLRLSVQHRCDWSSGGFEAKYIVGWDGFVKLRLCFVAVDCQVNCKE
jgi:hypothetical protein